MAQNTASTATVVGTVVLNDGAVGAAQLAPGETWGFSKRKWGLKGGGKSRPRKQKWELKVGV